MAARKSHFDSQHGGIHLDICEIVLELTRLQLERIAVLNVQPIKFSLSVKSTFAVK